MYVVDNLLTDSEFLMIVKIIDVEIESTLQRINVFKKNYGVIATYTEGYKHLALKYLILSNLKNKIELKAIYKEGGYI